MGSEIKSNTELEDLKVLKRSPDLLNNVKIATTKHIGRQSRSTTAYNGTNLVLAYMGVADILVK